MKIKYLAAIAATTSVLSVGLLTSCGPQASDPADPAADTTEPADPAADTTEEANPCAATDPADPCAADPCAGS